MAKDIIINDDIIKQGERKHIHLEIARLYDSTEMSLDIEVTRGKEDGPVLFLSAAAHGDEINGTEIIRRILASQSLNDIKGTVIAVPIVNAYGFNTKSRYLPDRRDLNRCFPGSSEGSLAARLADVFIRDVVDQSTHGIDFHTGAINRTNWPQIRACLDDTEVSKMAKDFAAPVILNEQLREGSLREYCYNNNVPIILFEGGEALRFQKNAIQSGFDGTLRVMAGLGMIDPSALPVPETNPQYLKNNYWVRAPQSGILITKKQLGESVEKNDVLGVITNAFGQYSVDITASNAGVIIGATTSPLLNQGDAAYHIAQRE